MTAIAPGFRDPVAHAQIAFRAIMDAMARPGSIARLRFDLAPPPPLSAGAAAVALALLDYESPFWLDAPLAGEHSVRDWIRFHTGAVWVEEPQQAAFAFIADTAGMPPFDRFSPGTVEYPDRSATLVLQADRFDGPSGLALAGPGIAARTDFAFSPMPENLERQLADNRALFPRGVDLILVADDAVAALPRSVRLLEEAV